MKPKKGVNKIYLNKRFIRYKNNILKILLAIVAILILLFFIITSEYIQITKTEITIKNQNLLVKRNISDSLEKALNGDSKFISKRIIYIFNRKSLENILYMSHPEIDNIETRYLPWDDFLVLVTERIPRYIYCVEETCDIIDTNAIKYTKDYGVNLIKIEGDLLFLNGQRVINKKNYNFIINLEKFLQDRKLEIEKITIMYDTPKVLRITFYLSEGLQLIFSSENTIYEASRAVSIALFDIFGVGKTNITEDINNLEYLDFRFKNKIIYK